MKISVLRTSTAIRDRRIVFPNASHQGYPAYGGRVTASMLLDAAPNGVKAIIFFGSAIRPPQTRVLKKKFLFFKWEETVHDSANDVDVVFIVDTGARAEVVRRELKHPVSGDYGEVYMVRHGFLHAAILFEDDLVESAKSGDQTSMNILKDGVLFAGETSLPLESKRAFTEKDDVYGLF